jgi:hypothetical protein
VVLAVRPSEAGRWRPLATGDGGRHGRERLRPFLLDNVTGEFTLIGGRPRSRRAPQKRQNRQKQLRRLFLVFLSFLRCAAEG